MGAKRAVSLPVSAPFHCPLMQPAADAMHAALADARIEAALVPVYANVAAAPVSDPDAMSSEERRVGKSVSVRVDLGGSRGIKNKKTSCVDRIQRKEDTQK